MNQVSQEMHADLTWLIKNELVSCEKKDYSWFFIFSGGGSIVTESPWRLLTRGRIRITSEDDGHLFGLEEPVNASVLVSNATKGKKVSSYSIRERTSDLTVEFEDDVHIEFLQLSGGYEAWRTYQQDDEVICMGGGELAILQKRMKKD